MIPYYMTAGELFSVRHSLREIGLRAYLYKMAATDPTHAKMVIPALDRRGYMVPSDDLDEPHSVWETT